MHHVELRQVMQNIDQQLTHVWMVRTFLKHCEEAEDDEELQEVHRGLYDFMLALGPALHENEPVRYLRMARKKWMRFVRSVQTFEEIQPEISGHMNFQMAARSLRQAVDNIQRILDAVPENDYRPETE